MKKSFLLGMTLGAVLALGSVYLGYRFASIRPDSSSGSPVAAKAARSAERALDLLAPAALAAKEPPRAQPAPERGGLIATYGVGGVLTRDGELWQYRPDRGRWLTLDESFGLEGKPTRLVPLPVPAGDVKLMETFGFLVSRADVCWLYDLETNSWKNVGAPPFQGQGR